MRVRNHYLLLQNKNQFKNFQDGEKGLQDLGDKASKLLDDASRTASRSGIANNGTANVNALQSEAQQTPVLDNSDLIERVKDSFSTATQNLGDFAQDAANDAR